MISAKKLFLSYGLVLFFVLLYFGFTNYNFLKNKNLYLEEPWQVLPKANVWASSTNNLFNTPELIMYRGGIKRHGVSRSYGPLPEELKTLWTHKAINVGVHSASKSSPIIDELGIYVGSDAGWFYAFDYTGKIRWKFFSSVANRGIHGTAAVDKRLVYFGTYDGKFFAINKKSGKPAWAIKLGDAIGASPALLKDSVLVNVETSPANGYLVKIDKISGNVIWKSPYLGEQSHSSPAIDKKTGLIFVGDNGGIVRALSLEDGSFRWQYREGHPIKSTPIVIGDNVYFTSWKGVLTSLNKQDGKKVWTLPLDGTTQSSPTLVPDYKLLVFSDDSPAIYAVHKDTGKVLWKRATSDEFTSTTTSATVAKTVGGRWIVWIACEKKSLCAISPKTGKILVKYGLPATQITSVPVVSKGTIAISTDGVSGGLTLLTSR